MMDKHWIAERIPHQGSMCLLDQVVRWSEDEIICQATSHLQPDNPLRANGQLGSSCLIEYAAQAMAIHGALLAGDAPAPKSGYLASVRQVCWHQPRIDQLDAALTIHATRLSGNHLTVMYQFEVHAGELLISGRASAILDAAALA